MKNKRINILIQVTISLLLIWVIYTQLDNKSDLIQDWQKHIKDKLASSWFLLLLVFFLLPVNYLLEAKKWHLLVNRFEKHSFSLALKGILTGTTAGILTPARLGDFIGKLMFISPENNWKAVWSNMTAGIAQNLVVGIGGLIGLIAMLDHQNGVSISHRYLLMTLVIVISGILTWIYYHLSVLTKFNRYLPAHKFLNSIKKSIKVVYAFEKKSLHKVLFLSLLRYIVFILQYVLLLSFWGVSYSWMIPFAITVIYLIQTLIPLPPVMGLFIRGEIALVLLSTFSSNGLLIMSAAFSLWVINLLIPSLAGMFYLYRTNITRSLGYEN